MSKHDKHTALAKPAYGQFGRNEWSVTGTDCNKIKLLASTIIAELSKTHNCAYVDTRHQKQEGQPELPGMLSAGAVTEYSNEISHSQFTMASTSDANLQPFFSGADFILVNGNHHSAVNQVIVIDQKKKQSLQKRIAGLTNVQLILLANDSTEPFEFVREWMGENNEVPVYSIDDSGQIIEFFQQKLLTSRPPLFGLVLAGGRSQRMGADKPSMIWHGKEQRYFVADELKNYCEQVFISCRQDQQNDVDSSYPVLADSFTGLGPYGAILSAFRAHPDAAWLVLASDLPLLTAQTLGDLVRQRNTMSVATAYQQPGNGKPEPLIAIWEPKSYPVLLSFLARGYSCPKKVLENNSVTLVQASDATTLMNVNTPADRELASRLLEQKSHELS